MNPRSTRMLVVAAVIVVSVSGLASSGQAQTRRTGGITHVACNDGVVVVSPNTLWPPNLKLATIDIAYVDNDHDHDALGLTINSISSNQDAADGTSQCGGSKGSDWSFGRNTVVATDPGQAATTVRLRAQRCGNLGARVYLISVTCTDGAPEATPSRAETVDVTVTVPHDQGKH